MYIKGIPFSKLDGDYAFILYDIAKNKIIFGKDPVGLKPLFYYKNNKDLIICSEIKVIEDLLKDIDVDYNLIKKVDINSYYVIENLEDSILNRFDITDIYDSDNSNDDNEYDTKNTIKLLLENAVNKRLKHTNKPVALLCSGGIDSTIITSLAYNFNNDIAVFNMSYDKGTSYDSMYADMFMSSLPNVKYEKVKFSNNSVSYINDIIRILETHDPNTIRASIPMYLLAKHIKENTDYKVILSGEGSDELFMGYNYFSMRKPTDDEAYQESIRLVKNLHSFDILRAERCFSAFGLELRCPFLDLHLIKYVLTIKSSIRNTKLEKNILRLSVKDIFTNLNIHDSLLLRQKERMSDGVGYNWVPSIINYCASNICAEQESLTTDMRLKYEKLYYKKIYDSIYKSSFIIPRELPLWAEDNTNVPMI